MSTDFIKFGFSAGVISPRLLFRSDLETYELAMRQGRNWYVDYFGGASTRQGLEFIDYLPEDQFPIRLANYRFNTNIADNFLVIFYNGGIRFVQNGGYVLETNQPITIVAPDGLITSPGHGYSTGDWVSIENMTYEIEVISGDTFYINRPYNGREIIPFPPSGVVARIETVSSPYTPGDLFELNFQQDKTDIIITHEDYNRRLLSRGEDGSWTLTEISTNRNESFVTNVAGNPSGGGSSGYLVAVTSVDIDGVESGVGVGALELIQNSVNYTATAGSVEITWSPAPDTAFYRIYSSRVVPQDEANLGMELGYIGQSFSGTFTNPNIVPDFATTPPELINPFENGSITYINITSGGSGYTQDTVSVSIGGPGAGFQGVPVVNTAGEITAVRILTPGRDYSAPVVNFTNTGGGTGTGATATAETTPLDNNAPTCSAKVQQRRIYGGTINNPDTIYGSRTGVPDNFDLSPIGEPTNPFILTLDTVQLTPIRYIVDYADGMFIFSDNQIYQVRGEDDQNINAASAKAVPQTEEGCARIPPIKIEREILYLTNAATEVNSLRPSNLPTYFVIFDTSQFSNHFLSSDNPIVSWTWAKAPHRLVWAVREDGSALSQTFVPKQNTYAWNNHTTNGFFRDTESVFENGLDTPYFVVERELGGVRRKLLERMPPRDNRSPEWMWAVDCGLRNILPAPVTTVQCSGHSGTIRVASLENPAIFDVSDVGKIFRAGGGKGRVTALVDPATIEVELFAPIRQVAPESVKSAFFVPGDWTLTDEFTVFSGLEHLEGEEVEILADGAVLPNQTVTNGAITLDRPASLVVAGLGFTGELETLPPTFTDGVVENKIRNVNKVAVQLADARGLEIGSDGYFYPLNTQAEAYDQVPGFEQALQKIEIVTERDYEGGVSVRKVGPVSATVLGMVVEYDFGDD